MSSRLPTRISGRDLEIFYRHACGMKGKEIAEDLGVTEQTVSNTINSDWARNELAILHARTLDKIANGSYSPLSLARSVSNEMLSIQVALARSPQVRAHTRARIADSILDRAGYRPATRVESVDMNDLFEKFSAEEAEQYAITGQVPDRFSGTQVQRFLAGARESDDSPDADFTIEIGDDSESKRGSDKPLVLESKPEPKSDIIEISLE